MRITLVNDEAETESEEEEEVRITNLRFLLKRSFLTILRCNYTYAAYYYLLRRRGKEKRERKKERVSDLSQN